MTSKLFTVAALAGSLGAAGTVGFYVSGMSQPAAVAEPARLAPVTTRPDATPPVARPPEPARTPAPAPPRRPQPAPDRRVERQPAPTSAAPAVEATPASAPTPTPALPIEAAPVPVVAPTVGELSAPARPRTELTVEADSVIGVRLERPVSSATAHVEDPVSAIVTRDVTVLGRTVIPAGSLIEGHVTFVEPGGKFREKARIGLRFTTLVLGRGERVPIETEAIFRDGESPATDATSKIGASAVVGTVLGAIIGGKKGAAIGGAAGAAGGTAVVAAGDRHDAVLAGGASLTLRLTESVVIAVDREP